MFKCPKCGNILKNFICDKCNHVVPIHNGVKYFCEEENINVSDVGHKYIGYDDINIHFSPSLIYWGMDHYGVYGVSVEDIVKRYGKGIVVLDLGCGLGQATIPFAKVGAIAIGVDISEKMLEFTYQRSKGKYENMHLCKMNAYNLNLADESVDVVVENAMIHLVDNPEQVYKEIYRVLKKDGKFIRFCSVGLPITEEQQQLSINTKKSISRYKKLLL